MIRILIFTLIVLLLVYIIFSERLRISSNRKLAAETGKLLKKIDKTYEHFIDERITMNILNQNSIDFDKKGLVDESMKQIMPYIDALHYQMQKRKADRLTIRYESKYFSNVKTLIESYYAQTSGSSGFQIPIAYDRVKNAFKKAIEADIEERSVQMTSRNY